MTTATCNGLCEAKDRSAERCTTQSPDRSMPHLCRWDSLRSTSLLRNTASSCWNTHSSHVKKLLGIMMQLTSLLSRNPLEQLRLTTFDRFVLRRCFPFQKIYVHEF